ncbi:MAG: hypothetical protein V1835_01435 [Candidatus Micrarchaeota archaeon]
MEPYITKKIGRKTLPKMYRYKARLMAERGANVTDIELFDEVFDAALAEPEKRGKKQKGLNTGKADVGKKWRFEDFAGFIKEKKGKFNADEEIDKVVYGV